MILFNFAKIGDNIEELISMKHDVEQRLLNDGSIKEKLKLDEFISNVIANTTIFYSCGNVIPFTILNGVNDTYIFYTDNNDKEEYINNLINNLDKVDFDISKLQQVPITESLNMKLDKETVFIKNGAYYR